MSGSSVTVPGSDPDRPVTISLGTGDVLHLASQIGLLLSTIPGGAAVTTADLANLPPAPLGTSELVINDSVSGSATIPAGYDYVLSVNSVPNTLTGSNLTLISGTAGGSFFITGQSTIAAVGGDNAITTGDLYVASAGPGNDTISASGIGTVAAGSGVNRVDVSGINFVNGTGQDTIVLSSGVNSVSSSGDNSAVFGSTIGRSLLTVTVSGSQATVSTGSSEATIDSTGSNALVFGGTGQSNVSISGTAGTVVGGSGASTVTTSSNTVLFGGTGAITFVGGAGTGSILGGTGSTENIIVGSGGVVLATGVNNTSTLTGGAGTSTVFGSAGSVVNVTGGGIGAIFLAGAGNQTLNAAGSSAPNFLIGGSSTANVALLGGSGDDTIFAGNGSNTLAGGGGQDLFAFFDGATGGHNFITDFDANDAVYLIGYTSAASASSLQDTALTDSSGVTLTLSDATQITFTNLATASDLNGRILYAPRIGS